MTQTLVMNKLIKFLELSHSDENKIIRNELLEKGFCFGFSLCYAAMNLIGKLDWWQAALNAVANWNETKRDLYHHIKLPNSDTSKRIQLKTIFIRVLNYIVAHQACYSDSSIYCYMPEYLNQKSLLDPKMGLFELCYQGKIKTISKRSSIAGYFTKSNLEKIITPDILTNTICLVSSLDHTVCIAYLDSFWLIYNANYDHQMPEIHKRYKCRRDLINELVRILNHTLSMIVAAIDDTYIPSFNKFMRGNAISLLQKTGLHIIASENEESIPVLFKHAIKSPKGHGIIAKALMTKDDYQWTGIRYLAKYASDYLMLAFELAWQAKNRRQHLVGMLASPAHRNNNKKALTELEMIAKNAGEYLENILEMIAQDSNIYPAMAIKLHKARIDPDILHSIRVSGNLRFFDNKHPVPRAVREERKRLAM